MNELIYQPEHRKAFLRCLPGGRQFGPSIDHRLTPCQVILSLSTEPVVLLEMKDAKRSFPNEASSGPVWVDRSGIAGGHPAKRPPNFGPDRVVYAYPALHYPKWRAEFPSLAVAFHAGVFGESFTLTGVNEETVCIGDIIRVGSCHLQLSEPGQPNQWPYASRPLKIAWSSAIRIFIGWSTNRHAHNNRRPIARNSRNIDVPAKDRGAFTHADQPERMRAPESLRRNSNAVILNFETDHSVLHFQMDPDLSSLRMAR